jgi:hypothetical protein
LGCGISERSESASLQRGDPRYLGDVGVAEPIGGFLLFQAFQKTKPWGISWMFCWAERGQLSPLPSRKLLQHFFEKLGYLHWTHQA